MSRDYENHMVIYPEPDPPRVDCPVCGDECERIYVDMNGDVVGCDGCLRTMDIQDYWNDSDREEDF